MGLCDIAGSGLITQELLNEIQTAHKDLYIPELGLAKQTVMVKYLTHNMYVKSLDDPTYSSKNLKEDFVKALNTRFEENTKDIEFLNSLPDNSEEHKTTIDNIEQNSKDLNVALGNINKLLTFSQRAFKSVYNVSTTKLSTTLDKDMVAADVVASEVENERTTFSDDFAIQQNSKLKIAGRLKAFLSFVKNKKVTDKGTTKDVKTFFGTEDYIEFGVVFDELQRMLAGTKPTFKDMLEVLESERDNAIGDANNSKAWLDDLVPKLKDLVNPKKVKKNPVYDNIKDLFVRVMLKHKASYKRIFANEVSESKPESENYLSLQDENTSNIGVRLHKEWKNSHMFSSLVHGSIYNEDKVNELYNMLGNLVSDLKAKVKPEDQEKFDILDKAFIDIGLDADPEFISALVTNKIKVYFGDTGTSNLITIVNQLRDIVNTRFRGEVLSANLNNDTIRGLAKAAAKFSKDDYTNMLRIGDKLVTSYPNNHNFANRVRDIKSTSNLSDFNKSVFAKRSLYWGFINELQEKSPDKNIIDQLDWFGLEYVSITPLNKSSSKRNLNVKATKLSDLDMEVLYVGTAFGSNTRYTDTIIPTSLNKQVTLKTQQGSFLTPTLSDKSRAMLFKGITFRVTEVENGGPTIKADAVDVYTDSVILSEVDRIRKFPMQAKSELNLSSFRADLFYFVPYLNDVFVKMDLGVPVIAAEGEEGAIPLVNAVRDTGMDDATFTELVHPLVKEDLLNKARARYTEWSELGLIDSDGFFKKHTTVQSGINPEANANAIELAVDITFSEELSNANFFQMIAGDPAQYYVPSTEEIMQPADSYTDIIATAANITKRLASENAPGEEASSAEDPEYLQLYLNDVIEKSDEFDSYVEILDPDKYNEYKKRKSKSSDKELAQYVKENLVAAPYYKIDTTDAQEYLTWKAQLKELKRYGEITAAEYETAYNILKENGALTGELLNKVLGPRKPVHSSTEPQDLNDGQVYHRKTYIKSSTFPLLPQFITEDMKLYPLRKLMKKLEDANDGMPVRAAYRTAVKVGFPEVGIDLVDELGEWNKDIEYLEDRNVLVLKTSGLRMQQDIPYDENKMDITTGTQPKKSLFVNLLNAKFKYKNKPPITGKELKAIFDKFNFDITQAGLESFNNKVKNEDGSLNRERLSKVLEREAKKRKADSRPVLDGLKVDETTGKFTSLLGRSANVDAYMDLINSIVNNSILKKKQRGQSNTLGSNAGIVSLENVPSLDGVIYAEGYDSTSVLKPMRRDKSGNTLPAEIIVPFKFPDNEGNIVDISTVMTDGVLDFTKIAPEVLEAFGFRTPTQLHPSMTYAKIVGFVPKIMGDLIIAPKEFISQMGSDFDADKLYSYLFNTEIVDGVLDVLDPMSKEELDDALTFIDDKVTAFFNKPFDAGKYNAQVREEKRKLIALQNSLDFDVTLEADVTEELKMDMYEDAFQKAKDIVKELNRKEFDKIRELDRSKALLKQQYVRSLENEVLEVYKTVILSPAAFSKVIQPLNNGQFVAHAEIIDELRNTNDLKVSSVISHKYNKEKIGDGNQGQDGISIFSSDAMLQAYMEGKPIVLGEYINKKWFPVSVEFGNQYKISAGELGLSKTIKKANKLSITPSTLISALQNISVDNVNVGAMSKINVNETTAGVYALLSMLGFEEDISTYFISQPIIIDFVKSLNNKRGLFAVNKKKSTKATEEAIYDTLVSKYDSTYDALLDDGIADFKAKDAHVELRAMLEDETYLAEQGTAQVAILRKFLRLREHARTLSGVKQFLNLDSKGVKRNIYKSNELLDKADNLPKLPIKGLETLLGNYDKRNKRFPIFIEATTLAGDDIMSGVKTLIDTFGEEFMETNPNYKFSSIVGDIEDTIKRPLGEQELHKVRHELINYTNSNFKGKSVQEVQNLKEKLFNDSSPASLYGKLTDLKSTRYGKTNPFVDSLDVSLDDITGKVIINFSKVPGDNLQNDAVYAGFIAMLSDTGPISSVYNKVIPSEVAQLLTYYSLLKGGAVGQSFNKFIPVDLINSIVDVSFDENNKLDSDDFVAQYFQNNSSTLPVVEGHLNTETDVLEIEYTVGEVEPMAVLHGTNEGLYLKIPGQQGMYYKAEKFEVPYLSDYIFTPVVFNDSSEYADSPNNSITGFIADKEATTIKELYNQLTKLNISPERRALIDSLQSTNDINVRIVSGEGMTAAASYNYNTKVIKLNRKKISKFSNDKIAKLLIHEHMHDRQTKTLDTFSENPNLVSKEEAAAIERIQEHIFNTTDLITKDPESARTQRFKEYLWFRFSTFNPEVIQRVLNLTALPSVYNEINNILQVVSDNPGTAESVIHKQFNGFEELETYLLSNNGEQTLFNTMSTIYEYGAVVPSEMETLADMDNDFNKATYGTVFSNITNLLKAMFKRLGITSDAFRAVIDDIYTLSRIKPEEASEITPSVVHNGDNVRIVDNTLTYDSNDATVLPDNLELYNKLIDDFIDTFEGEAFSWKKYTEEDAIAISNQPTATIVEKLSALSTLERPLQKSNPTRAAISRLRTSLHAQKTTIIVENPTGKIPETLKKVKKEDIVTKKGNTRDNFFKKIESKVTRVQTKDNTAKEDAKEFEYKTLIEEGEETMIECGVTNRKRSRKWAIVNATPAFIAAKGAFIENTSNIQASSWAPVKASLQNQYAHGGTGQYNNNLSNTKWEVVTKLEGPSHAQGGIDLTINNGEISYSKGGAVLKAAYGMFIAADGLSL